MLKLFLSGMLHRVSNSNSQARELERCRAPSQTSTSTGGSIILESRTEWTLRKLHSNDPMSKTGMLG